MLVAGKSPTHPLTRLRVLTTCCMTGANENLATAIPREMLIPWEGLQGCCGSEAWVMEELGQYLSVLMGQRCGRVLKVKGQWQNRLSILPWQSGRKQKLQVSNHGTRTFFYIYSLKNTSTFIL